MRAIVLVDENWGIGLQGEQILYLKEDLQRFVRLTRGHVVIYGRKTMATFPAAKPLKHRLNIILSRSLLGHEWPDREAIVCGSLADLQEKLIDLEALGYLEEEFFLIGGASLYRDLLPKINQVDVTYVKLKTEADVYFPNLDEAQDFYLSKCSEQFLGHSESGVELAYEYRTYKRKEACRQVQLK